MFVESFKTLFWALLPNYVIPNLTLANFFTKLLFIVVISSGEVSLKIKGKYSVSKWVGVEI